MKSAKPPARVRPPVEQSVESSPVLAPRLKLFWSLAGLTLLWIIALLLMYWFSVRPERERVSPPVDGFHLPASNP